MNGQTDFDFDLSLQLNLPPIAAYLWFLLKSDGSKLINACIE